MDNRGNPVSGATVYMPQTSCRECVDYPQVVDVTDYQGVFFITSEVTGKKTRFLIEGPVPGNLWNPVTPVDDKLKRIKVFAGRYLEADRGSIQLGEVHPDIVYSPVTIDLPKLFGNQKNLLNDIGHVELRLVFGHVLVEKAIRVHERAVDMAGKRLNFALPNGEWQITVILYSGDRKVSRTVQINVNSAQGPSNASPLSQGTG